jgi:hypothetical protein
MVYKSALQNASSGHPLDPMTKVSGHFLRSNIVLEVPNSDDSASNLAAQIYKVLS